MFYTENYKVQSLVCDATDHLSLWGLSRLFQEVAEGHTFSTGIGYNDLIKQNKAWVLCRMLYDVKRMPRKWDNIMLTTWSRGTNGLFAVRDFRMEDAETHEVLASATAYWAVIDFSSRHVTRLHDLMAGYEHHDTKATDVDELRKLRMPADINADKNLVQTLEAMPSMLDHTQHVNNAEYLKWISNFRSEIFQKPIQLQVDYVLETHLGEKVEIYRCEKTEIKQMECDCDSLSQGCNFYQIVNSRGVSVNVIVF